MRVELTEAGETERYGEVLETCFEAVGALRRDLDNAQTGARLWSELAAIDRATFDFASSRRSAYSTCSTLARTLHDVDGAAGFGALGGEGPPGVNESVDGATSVGVESAAPPRDCGLAAAAVAASSARHGSSSCDAPGSPNANTAVVPFSSTRN